MRKFQFLCIVLSLSFACVAAAQQGQPGQQAVQGPGNQTANPNAQSQKQLLGYAIGYNIGGNLRANQAEIDVESLKAGVADGLGSVEPKWPEERLATVLQHFQERMQRHAIDQMRRVGEVNKGKADAFLAQNRTKEGVQVTPSGLQYKVIKQGDGPSPTANDVVRCHYRGTLIDGTEFDSSQGGEPAEFPVRGVIPGWTEALQKMHVGDKWQLFVPPDLAYGMDSPTPAIEPNSLLIFEIELLGIVKP